MRKQKRIYVVNTWLLEVDHKEPKPYNELTNEEFIDYAEKQGGVFSLDGFATQWNLCGLAWDIGKDNYKMRIL